MKCTYTYKGNLIGNDVLLADFICEKLPLIDLIGDTVFEMNATGANNIAIIEGAVTEAGKKAKEQSKEYYKNRTVEYADDGTMNIEELPPVMGVNAFIAAFRTPDGSVITPEFRTVEYWNNRLASWKPKTIDGSKNPGVFTEDETQIINEYLAISDPGTTLNPELIYSDETYNKWKDVIEQKWKQLGQIGTALHSVSEWLFSKVDGKYIFEEESSNPDYAKLQYERWKSDYLSVYDRSVRKGDLITEAQFLEMVKMLLDFRVNLQLKFGAKARFFAELDIAGDINEYQGCHTLHGVIDLLVVDENGYVHIVDYKTSPKSYDQYASAKKRAFTLLLGTYQRILRKFGVNTQGGLCIIVPITLKGFHLDNTGETDPKNLKYTYDRLSYKQNDLSEDSPVIQLVLTEVNSENINDTLDKFIPLANKVSATSSNLIEKITKQMAIWFPNHLTDRNMSEEQISEKLKEEKAFEPTALGTLEYKTPYSDDPIVISINDNLDFAKVLLVKKVQEQLRSINDRNIQRVDAFINAFDTAVKTGLSFHFAADFKNSGFDKVNLENLMKQYCNGRYEIVDLPTAKNFGLVVLLNIQNKACVAFKIVGGDLQYNYKFTDGRTNINGSFAKDIEESSNPNSLILKANRGNIEGMEAMLVLNSLDWVGTPMFESINILNPRTLRLMPIYNSEFIYNWNALTKHSLLEEDRFKAKKVLLLSLLDYFRLKIDEIMNSGAPEYNPIKGELTSMGFDWLGETNPLKVKMALEQIMQYLNTHYSTKTTRVARDSSSLADPIILLYNHAAIAYNDINGVIMRQQTKDSDKWLETVMRIPKEGAQGLNLENPGNFSSLLLNTVSVSVKNVNLKVRDIILRQSYEVSEYVKELKQSLGFGVVLEYIGNQTSLYTDMTEIKDGDFLFVDPKTLTGAKRKFLEYVLDTINKDRWPNDVANFETWKLNHDLRYYRVPLLATSTGSKLKTNNLLGSLRNLVLNLAPKNAIANTVDAITFASPEIQLTNNDIYNARVIFDAGNAEESRMKMLRKYGANAYEHNLEVLLLNHSYQYARKRAFDSELIKMKACAIAIAHQGNFINPVDRENFRDTLDYLDNIVKVLVHNDNLADSKVLKLMKLTGKVRSAASLLALGFSPVQWTYQRIDGIWKNLGLVIKKPDGTDAFTAKNMFDSAKHVETDLFHSHLTPTMLSRVNELYGINDMDADQYANRLSSDKGWFTHVYDLAFRFTSRPDYYNRMTIFEAQMRKDGSFEAHSLNKNGELVYDFSKDERYKDYARAKKEGKLLSLFTAQEQESYARYFAAAKEFINEGVVNADGSLFKLGDDLPRAYSNRESQSMKSIADNVYGYYNKEDKSLVHYMFLGGLYMLMKTYWSAKKNLYLAPGGTKLLGKFVDYQENGKLLYYTKVENGEIDLSKGFVTIDDPNCSGVKVRRWLGQYQEGIVLTVVNFLSSVKENGISDAWLELWNNPNDNLRTCYRSNLKHLAIDLFMCLIIGKLVALLLGKWDDDEKREFSKDKNMGNAVNYISSHFIYLTITRSFQDFDFVKSIAEPLIEWRPYSFGAVRNIVEDGWDAVTGEKTVLNATSENISAIRTIKPALQVMRDS